MVKMKAAKPRKILKEKSHLQKEICKWLFTTDPYAAQQILSSFAEHKFQSPDVEA